MAHHACHVVGHDRRIVVQRDQICVALERGVCRDIFAIVGPGEPEPPSCRCARATRDGLLEHGERPADMVEHPVEQDPQPPVVSGADEPVERGVAAQPGIDPVVVDRVIAMGGGLEYRAERDSSGTEICRIVQPRTYAVEPAAAVAIGPSSVGAGETKRVDQPPQRRRDPGWLGAAVSRVLSRQGRDGHRMVNQAVDQSRRDAQHLDLRMAQRAQGIGQPSVAARPCPCVKPAYPPV